jgi:hypothetical protein
MAIAEDLDVFLTDFGVSVTAGAVSGLGVLDMPGQSIMGDMVISNGYRVTCRWDEFGDLAYGDSVTVDGEVYRVQENKQISDGKFCSIEMERVGDAPPWVPGATDVEIILDGDFL